MVNMKTLVRASLMAAVAASALGGAAHAQLSRTIDTAERSTRDGAETQATIDRLDDQRTDIELEYRALLEQIESQRLFVEQQEVFIRSQENEIASLRQQIERVASIETDLAPMMREMVVNLQEFIDLDLPFQLDGEGGRLARIERLFEIIDDPNISPAERYRVILNAYDIELSYGRNVRIYEEDVLEDGVPVKVTTLQMGRVAVIRTYPGDRMTILYPGSDGFVPLAGSHFSNVQRALRIADGVAMPEIYEAPVPAASAAQ